ncbi:ribonucleotide-diphosphate reductase subunit beta, partial [Paenibacillus larvae]
MLTRQKVFDTTAPNKSDKIIEGSCSSILNWDDIRQPEMYTLYKVLIANHWIPSESPMNKDKLQLEQLTAQDQE